MPSRSWTLAILLLLFSYCTHAQTPPKHRMIVLTDIEADPDDTQTMVRLLLYANQIDILGIIATTSVHQRNRVAPESIRKVIQGYEKVRPNLELHESGFPSAQALYDLVKQGLPQYGMLGVGEDKDSEGSEWIIHILEDNDPRPLWVSVWGGPNTLAQALFRLAKTKSSKELKKLLTKLRIYTISDQDDSAIWIRKNFPELFYIVSPGGYGNATWTGILSHVPGINNETITNNWIADNIQQSHGPLGSLYPDVAYGMEGDTPSWLGLIPNGLNEPEHPDWGGWGGRYVYYQPEYATLDINGFTGGVPIEPEPHAIWTNATDNYTPYVYNDIGRAVKPDTCTFNDNRVTLWRWRDDFQNDFAARMDWCVMPFKQANHPPVPALAHPELITVRSGDRFVLDAGGTSDPDGDNLSYLWYHYPEAGTYSTPLKINAAENLYAVHLVAPRVSAKQSAHFILEVTDKGIPRLTRYKRVVVTILPK